MEIGSKNIFNSLNIKNKQNNYCTAAPKIDIGNAKLKNLIKDTVSFSSNKKLSVAEQIDMLQGDPFDNANKIKEILLQDMGLTKDCIQVEILQAPQDDAYCDRFNMSTGNILLHRNPNSTIKEVAITIRHELEHFKQALGYVKNFGTEEYKKYVQESGNIEDIQTNCPNVSTKFNSKLWENKKLYNAVDITQEQCISYKKSFQERKQLELEPDSIYKNLKRIYLYYNDPQEKEAYKAQDDFALELGAGVENRISPTFMEEFSNIEKKIDEIRTKKPHFKKYIPLIFEKAYQKGLAQYSIDDSYGVSEKDMKKLFDVIVSKLDNFLRKNDN